MNRMSVSAVLIAALTAAGLAGCSSAAAPPTTTPPPIAAPATAGSASAVHNDADVTFVESMIPHHTQAVAMSQLVTGHTANPKITALATQIAQAQGPEITQMQAFLQSWNKPVAPSNAADGMAGMGSGPSSMPGMMSDQQMTQLATVTGAAFDRMFLQMMTAHHSGAITMAQTELRDGASPVAKTLAQKIIDAQQAEITRMTQLHTNR